MMYHMKNIINHDDEIELPKCMYQIRNPYSYNKEDEADLGILEQSPTKKMTDLENRQNLLLKKLDTLYERIMTISSYCKPSDNIVIKNTTKVTEPEEVVLALSPDNIPYYVRYVLKNSSVPINVTGHIHSSVTNEKATKVKQFLSMVQSSTFNDSKINLRLIFKPVSANSELKLSSLAIPIVGNVNILRYLAFAYPEVILYDHDNYAVDSLLDLCHLLERTSEKNKEAIIKKLFSQCNQFIYGDNFSIIDLAAYNIIKQWRNPGKSVPKNWLNQCDKLCS